MDGEDVRPLLPARSTGNSGQREVWLWVLQRFSGVLLVVLVGGHLWVEHFLHPGQVIQLQTVAARLIHRVFVVLDFSLLAVVVFHGLNGVRRVVIEYWPRSQQWSLRMAVILGVLTWAWGADILSAFLFKTPWVQV